MLDANSFFQRRRNYGRANLDGPKTEDKDEKISSDPTTDIWRGIMGHYLQLNRATIATVAFNSKRATVS